MISYFKDISLSDALDALIINPIDNENIFIIWVNYNFSNLQF